MGIDRKKGHMSTLDLEAYLEKSQKKMQKLSKPSMVEVAFHMNDAQQSMQPFKTLEHSQKNLGYAPRETFNGWRVGHSVFTKKGPGAIVKLGLVSKSTGKPAAMVQLNDGSEVKFLTEQIAIDIGVAKGDRVRTSSGFGTVERVGVRAGTSNSLPIMIFDIKLDNDERATLTSDNVDVLMEPNADLGDMVSIIGTPLIGKVIETGLFSNDSRMKKCVLIELPDGMRSKIPLENIILISRVEDGQAGIAGIANNISTQKDGLLAA